MNDPDPLLNELRKAGAMVGMSNEQWWLDLVEKHGQDLVMAAVTKLYAATRQPVNAAVTGKACAEVAQRLQDERDDAAEDAAMDRQAVRAPRTVPAVKYSAAAALTDQVATVPAISTHPIPESPHAAPAAATDSIPSLGDDCSDSSRAAGEATPEAKAAAIAAPWGLTKPTQENDMATIKQLVKRIEEEVARRGIMMKQAMEEIGASKLAIYAWRKDQVGEAARAKIETWLPESAKKPAADEGQTSHREAIAVEPERKPRQTRTVERAPATTPADLLDKGRDLADRLRGFGCDEYAATVEQLVEKLVTVRSALGG